MKTTIKAIITMIVFAVLSVGTAKADDYSFTVVAGLNIAKTTDNSSRQLRSGVKLGFNVGGFFSTYVSDLIDFEGGVLLSTKGTQGKVIYDTDMLTQEYAEISDSYTYIDIPLLAKYKLMNEELGVYGGLQPSILLSAERKEKLNGESKTSDISDVMRNIDLATVFGAAYTHESGVTIRVWYVMGHIPIFDDEHQFTLVFNRVAQISLGYTF